jgi:hypothetical protein
MTDNINADEFLLERERALSKFAGSRLTSVQFVLDYLILGFDEAGALTTLVWPKIVTAAAQIDYGADPYRNVLCSFIKTKIASSTIGTDETICITFETGAELRIPLRSYQGRGERAILTGPNHYLLVF